MVRMRHIGHNSVSVVAALWPHRGQSPNPTKLFHICDMQW